MEWTKRAPAPHVENNDREIAVRQIFELDDFAPSEAVGWVRELEKIPARTQEER